MKKGSVPLVPQGQKPPTQPVLPGGLPGTQAGISKVPLGQVPVSLADLGLTPGPLGNRRTNPETMAKIASIYKRMGEDKASAPVVMTDAPTDTVRVPPGPEVSVPRIPEPPPPAAFGQPSLPTPPAAEEGEEPPTAETPIPNGMPPVPQRTATPMQVFAESGAETRIQGLSMDSGFMKAIMWKASSERREFFDKNRCRPIDWSSIFTSFDVRQDVLIWTKPMEIWATFRTMTSDDEYLVRRVIKESYSRTDADLEVGAVITTVAAGLVRIKDMVLPPIPPPGQNSGYEVRLKIMKERVEMVHRLPYPLTSDLAINYSWFVLRVQEAQRAGELGNG